MRSLNKPSAHNIGGYIPMIDGPEKVSGRAKYTADIVAPGSLPAASTAAPTRTPRSSAWMCPRR